MQMKMLASIDTGKPWDLNFNVDHLVISIFTEKILNSKKFIKSLKGVHYNWDTSINSVSSSDVDYVSSQWWHHVNAQVWDTST